MASKGSALGTVSAKLNLNYVCLNSEVHFLIADSLTLDDSNCSSVNPNKLAQFQSNS